MPGAASGVVLRGLWLLRLFRLFGHGRWADQGGLLVHAIKASVPKVVVFVSAVTIIAVILGIAFEKQNVAFMVGLAFAIAASANFPVLIMSVFWSKMTTRGAMIGGWIGLTVAVVLTVISKAIWVDVIGNAAPLITLNNPAIISIPSAFIAIWLFSVTDKSKRAEQDLLGFEAQDVRCQTGIGAEGASGH